MAKEYVGRVVFANVDIDENHLTVLLWYQSIPTTLILKNGKIIDVLIRALLKLQIENNLKAAISLPNR